VSESNHNTSWRNHETGALVLDTENPGDVAGWAADDKLVVRVAELTTPDGGTEIRVRDDASSPWRSWMKTSADENLGVHGVSKDGKSLLIESSLGADTTRVIERDIASGKEKVLAFSDEVDAGIVMVNPYTRGVEAVSFEPGRRSWKVLDPSVQADFDAIDKLAHGDWVVINRDQPNRKWLVGFTSDRGPTKYFSWDRETKQGTFLFTNQSKLENLQLSEMKPVVVKTRDGFSMNAYLTLHLARRPRLIARSRKRSAGVSPAGPQASSPARSPGARHSREPYFLPFCTLPRPRRDAAQPAGGTPALHFATWLHVVSWKPARWAAHRTRGRARA
jgi:dipeptidyl aminopeptidase/acylaminoacyl peptidase